MVIFPLFLSCIERSLLYILDYLIMNKNEYHFLNKKIKKIKEDKYIE
jgi:hypothetical protein